MSDVKKKKKAGNKSSPGGKKKGNAASKGEPSAKAAAEEEKKRLQAELGVLAATRAAQDAAAKALEEELMALRQRHTHEAATATDVLASQQRRQQQAQDAAHELERQLEVARSEAAALQSSLAAALADFEAAEDKAEPDVPGGELLRVMSQARRQEDRLEAQGNALEALHMRLQRTEAELAGERATVAALRIRAQGRSELRFIRASPFLVHVGREKLGGSLPAGVGLRPGGALAVAGRQLVLSLPGSMHAMDLASATWCPSGREAAAGRGGSTSLAAASGVAGPAALSLTAVSGRAACSVGSKLFGFGGECQGRLLPSSTQFLHPDLQAWLAAPGPADATAPEPPPRTDAALAYCPALNAVFMYGGQGEGGCCMGDLWRLDLSNMVWTRLDRLHASRPLSERARSPCMSEAPPGAAGAALAVAPDASRLWLLGGRMQSGRCCNTLHWFDLTMNYWAAVEPQTWTIDPRSSAVMSCVGRYMLVAGGLCPSPSGQAVYRQDCVLYDPAANSWDIVSHTAFAPQPPSSREPRVAVSVAVENKPDCCSRRTTSSSSGGSCSSGKSTKLASAPGSGSSSAPAFLGVGTCVFHDGKLLVLKAGEGGGGVEPLSELWAVELQLPSAIEAEQLRSMQCTTTVTDLTLKEESVGTTSVQLSWRAPTAGADKLLSFKLMVTNADGRAREAYEGRESSCEVTGLMPSAQYVFCVKALFDDTTFLWSEPMMVTTKKLVAGKTGTTSMGTTGAGSSAGSGGTGVRPPAKGGGERQPSNARAQREEAREGREAVMANGGKEGPQVSTPLNVS